MFYAKLTSGIVTSVTETHGELPPSPDLVGISTYDTSLLGCSYDGEAFHAPEPEPTPVDPCQWLIDIGPFYDRFGAAKMAVLTSADAGVKAILQDVNIREWVDLTRPDVAQSLEYVGSKVPTVTPELQAAILTAPVSSEENRALRKLYFS